MNDIELRRYYLNSCIAKIDGAYTPVKPTPELLNMKQAANYLGIKEKTLYNWVSKEKIPVTKVGNKNAFRKEILDNWLNERTEKKSGKQPVKYRRRK